MTFAAVVAVYEGLAAAHPPLRTEGIKTPEQHGPARPASLVDGRAVAERGVGVAVGGRAARAAGIGPRRAVRRHAGTAQNHPIDRVTCRLHGRYRVPGLREGSELRSELGRRGESRDNMCLDRVQTRAGGQEGQAASHAVPDRLMS